MVELVWKNIDNINFNLSNERICVLNKWINHKGIKTDVVTQDFVLDFAKWMKPKN